MTPEMEDALGVVERLAQAARVFFPETAPRIQAALRLVADKARENVQAEVVAKTQATTARALEVARMADPKQHPYRLTPLRLADSCADCGAPAAEHES